MSDPRLPVEVEPWSDGHWSRVERELFEQLDASAPVREERRPRASRRVLAGGLAVAAAAVLVFAVRPAGFLRSSDRLRVATSDSASEVTVGESSLIVAPKSLVMVSGDDERGIDVVLDRGAVTCEVAPRKGRPPFVVDAGEVRVRVMGTRFTVARDASAIAVTVDHGVVEVSASGQVTVLHDGERWPGAGAGVNVGPGAGSNAGPGANAGANVGAGVVPAGPVEPPGATTSHPKSAQGASAPATRPSTADVGAAANSAPTTPPVPAAPSPQEAYESAARIEKTRPDDAAALYRGVIAGGTAWSSSALFALARLEADRGHRDGAQRLLNDYLTRYPRGLNADDARALLQRMQ
jgi:hypothetical protein